MIPKCTTAMDAMIEADERFPENILRAQQDRHSIYLKIAIRYPQDLPSDGDGLGFAEILKVYGVYSNDAVIDDNELLNHSRFRSVHSAVGSRRRSRLVGFDTQEAPLAGGRIDTVPQPYWIDGRNFLVNTLEDVRHGLRQEECIIVADCFGIDIFQRLLIDIRGIYRGRSGSLEELPQPTLRRFEIAERFLDEGVAYPTYSSYTNDALLGAFISARDNRKGAFGADRGGFINPYRCRKRRWQNERDCPRLTRKRYKE